MTGFTYQGAQVRLKGEHGKPGAALGIVVDIDRAWWRPRDPSESDQSYAERCQDGAETEDRCLVWWSLKIDATPDAKPEHRVPAWVRASALELANPKTAYRADLFGMPILAIDTDMHGDLGLRTPNGAEFARIEMEAGDGDAGLDMRGAMHRLIDLFMDQDEMEKFDYTSDFDLLQFLHAVLETELDPNIRYLIESHTPVLEIHHPDTKPTWRCSTCYDENPSSGTMTPADWSCGTIRALVAFLFADHDQFEEEWGLTKNEIEELITGSIGPCEYEAVNCQWRPNLPSNGPVYTICYEHMRQMPGAPKLLDSGRILVDDTRECPPDCDGCGCPGGRPPCTHCTEHAAD